MRCGWTAWWPSAVACRGKDARDAVKRGRVEVDGEPVTDPGRSVPEGAG
ncbi:MAG: hypothetical protein H6736_12780 [Alphaproteobacteria bacterium]|nr:hypothetical protein [Alphaproteobacteria bacterium]